MANGILGSGLASILRDHIKNNPEVRDWRSSGGLSGILGMDPNAERLGLLPHPKGTLKSEGRGLLSIKWDDWIGPQFLYDLVRAVDAPANALRGTMTNPEAEAANVGLNFMGQGLLAQTLRGSTPGILGITAYHGTTDDAMRVAQRNAAKPISEGGLGLPANNTAAQRADALGFTTKGYRGSKREEVSHDKPIWWSEDPVYANAYSAQLVKSDPGHAGNVMPLLVKIGKEKEFQKFNVGGVPDLHRFGGFNEGVTTGLRRYPYSDHFPHLEGKVWEALTLPQNVRSRFAAFDPFLINEAGLMK